MILYLLAGYTYGGYMEKNLLKNIYKLMILMRSDIYNKDNNKICEQILAVLNFRENNESLLCRLNKIINLERYINLFESGNEGCVNLEEKEIKILTLGIRKIDDCLKIKNYKFAYDMIDALHIFPEILANREKINMKHYWNVYFEVLIKKYNDKDLNDLKKLF